MLPQVQEEGVAGPVTFGFYNIKGDPMKKVFEGGANLNAMALERVHEESLSSFCHDCNHFGFGEGAGAFPEVIGKEGTIGRGGVDQEVVG